MDSIHATSLINGTLIKKRYWPFPVLPNEQLSAEGRQMVAFLDAALRTGWQPYDIDEAVIGATAPTGRVGEVIRRGGRGRYWEIVLADAANEPVSRYVDGLERAFDAVSAWLQGESVANALMRIENAIVAKPGERGW